LFRAAAEEPNANDCRNKLTPANLLIEKNDNQKRIYKKPSMVKRLKVAKSRATASQQQKKSQNNHSDDGRHWRAAQKALQMT